jgi:hypothetical protein
LRCSGTRSQVAEYAQLIGLAPRNRVPIRNTARSQTSKHPAISPSTVGAALAPAQSIALPVRGIAHDFHRNHLRANRESFFLHPWRDLHVRGAFSLARAGPARPHRPTNRGLPAKCIRPSAGRNNAGDSSVPRTRTSSDTPEQSPRRVAHRYDHSDGTGSLIKVLVTDDSRPADR